MMVSKLAKNKLRSCPVLRRVLSANFEVRQAHGTYAHPTRTSRGTTKVAICCAIVMGIFDRLDSSDTYD